MQWWRKTMQMIYNWNFFLKIPENKPIKKQGRGRDCTPPGALPIDWQLINVTECRATGQAMMQRRINTTEEGAAFSFPAQASPQPQLPPPPPPPFAFRAQRVQRAEQTQIRFHHTPHHLAYAPHSFPSSPPPLSFSSHGPLPPLNFFFNFTLCFSHSWHKSEKKRKKLLLYSIWPHWCPFG